jgi:nitrogen fixation NifU-like protein
MNPEVKLDELYQEVILDHNRRPRNYGKLEHPTAYSHGVNPLCGDDYHLYLEVDNTGVIRDLAFEGSGCAISKSSASMMGEAVLGKTVGQAKKIDEEFLNMLTSSAPTTPSKEGLGKLKIFEGVKNFPARVKCAALIWRALEDALGNKSQQVTTQD